MCFVSSLTHVLLTIQILHVYACLVRLWKCPRYVHFHYLMTNDFRNKIEYVEGENPSLGKIFLFRSSRSEYLDLITCPNGCYTRLETSLLVHLWYQLHLCAYTVFFKDRSRFHWVWWAYGSEMIRNARDLAHTNKYWMSEV